MRANARGRQWASLSFSRPAQPLSSSPCAPRRLSRCQRCLWTRAARLASEQWAQEIPEVREPLGTAQEQWGETT